MIKTTFKYVSRVMAILGFVTFAAIALMGWKIHNFMTIVKQIEPISNQSIISLEVGGLPMNEINLHGGLVDQFRGYNTQSLLEILDAINFAIKDPRVKGLFLSIEGNHLTLSQAHELHEALAKFKAAGKPIHSFGYSFCESTNGTTNYYLASVADHITMQPAAMFNMNGFALQSYFLKGLFDDMQISIQADGREEYKGVIESYTRKDFSAPVKENLHNLLDHLMLYVHGAIAKNLKLPVEAVTDIVATSPHSDHYPLEKGFITDLAYKDEAKEKFKQELSKKSNVPEKDSSKVSEGKNSVEKDLELEDVKKEDVKIEKPKKAEVIKLKSEMTYVHMKSFIEQIPDSTSQEKVGIIIIDGDITAPGKTSESTYDPYSPENVDRAFSDILKDKAVKAVVFRINSRGGAASGAETLWHAVKRTVDAGMPVVVSMGGTAASAGYYIAAPATKIFALPTTITGSIGVAFGKPNFRKATEKYGVTWDTIEVGKGGTTWSVLDDFSPEVWERIQKNTDNTYQVFMGKVVEGRKLDKEAVHSVAKGQVWTGGDAKEHKLVDELGGFFDAVQAAKNLGNIKDENPQLILFNRQPVSISNLLSLFEMDTTERLKTRLLNALPQMGMQSRFGGDLR